MPKRFIFIIMMALILSPFLPGCTAGLEKVTLEPGIIREPEPQNLFGLYTQPLAELPLYNPAIRSRPDLRSRDLTHLDLSASLDTLLHSNYNTMTLWPDSLPEPFNPEDILDLNKNPGLNIRMLHDQGITGKGIGVAIIDSVLLTEHEEYQSQIKMYGEINVDQSPAEFHGASMASILVGQSAGIAPDADLYYVAVKNYDATGNDLIHNQAYTAQAIRGLIKLNETLPAAGRIRVISISQWWSPYTKGYAQMQSAVSEAKAAGIFVVSCNLWQYDPRFHIQGLIKDTLADPDQFTSYQAAPWDHWVEAVNRNGHGDFYLQELESIPDRQALLIPSGSTVSAGAEHSRDYFFNPAVNWSNTIPYVAGLYALTCQVYPDVTPELFWETAHQTGVIPPSTVDSPHTNIRIINPQALMVAVQSLAD